MKGIIFNILEDFVTENYNLETYEKLISQCQLKTKAATFVGPGTYPDEDLLEIVSRASGMTQIPVPELVRAFGKFCFPKLAKRYPIFVKPHSDPKSFLKTVDSVIHVEVRKLYKDTELPDFKYSEPSPNELIMSYRSKRKLCPLIEGLIAGVGEYFNSPINLRQTQCLLNGAPSCDFHLSFVAAQQLATGSKSKAV